MAEKMIIRALINEIMECDGSSSSEDDIEQLCYAAIMHIQRNRNRLPRLQNYVEEVIPQYTDETFKSHFRMLPSTFSYILEFIKPSLMRKKPGSAMISPNKQLLVAIWKMATPDSYRSICEKFNISRATALFCVRRVVKALAAISSTFIIWPQGEKVNVIFQGFAATSGFPGVIGAIDGTHINIRAPAVHPEAYINRKGHHSIQLQAVCDHRCRFTHCYAGNVGSVHDQRVFRLSDVNQYLNDPEKFPNDSHLLGDAAYALQANLMTPYRDNGHLTERQHNYNFCHASARMAIERAFGLLKGRFRSLLTVLDIQRTEFMPEYIIACCVLHNICILKNDEFPVEINFEEENMINEGNHPHANNSEKRDRICNELIMRNV